MCTVHNGTAARPFKDFKDFWRNMNVTEDELDQFEEQICKMFTRFLVKKIKSGSGTIIPDPA